MLTFAPHQKLYVVLRIANGNVLFTRMLEPYGKNHFKIHIMNRGHTAFISKCGQFLRSFSLDLQDAPVDLLWKGEMPAHINPVTDIDAAMDWVMGQAWRNPVETALRDHNDIVLAQAAELLSGAGYAKIAEALREMCVHSAAPAGHAHTF